MSKNKVVVTLVSPTGQVTTVTGATMGQWKAVNDPLRDKYPGHNFDVRPAHDKQETVTMKALLKLNNLSPFGDELDPNEGDEDEDNGGESGNPVVLEQGRTRPAFHRK